MKKRIIDTLRIIAGDLYLFSCVLIARFIVWREMRRRREHLEDEYRQPQSPSHAPGAEPERETKPRGLQSSELGHVSYPT